MDQVKLSAIRRRASNRRRARVAGATTTPVSTADYKKIIEAGECVYCGGAANTVDHVRPITKGGRESLDNLVPACGSCNNRKRARLLTGWDQAKVMRAVRVSPKVAAEHSRLMALAKTQDP